MLLNRLSHGLFVTALLPTLALVGCPENTTFEEMDAARRRRDGALFDAGPTPVDAIAVDAPIPDAPIPDAPLPDAPFDAPPDAWAPDIGADCTLGTSSGFSIVGEAGDFVTGGMSFREPAGVTWVAHDATDSMRIDVNPFMFQFVAPPGETLRVGTYPNAGEIVGGMTGPGVGISRGFRHCTTATEGSFTVHELGIVGDGRLHFRATFTQRCNGSPTGLSGCIRYTAP